MYKKWISGLLFICACNGAIAGDKPDCIVAPVLIAESDMSQATLEQLFRRSFLKTSQFEKSGLSIQLGSGVNVLVRLDETHKLLHYYKVFGFNKPEASPGKISLANEINDNVILVRASVPKENPDSLVLDYFLPYEDGIPAYQIVATLRYFSEVSSKAVNQYDVDNLVR